MVLRRVAFLFACGSDIAERDVWCDPGEHEFRHVRHQHVRADFDDGDRDVYRSRLFAYDRHDPEGRHGRIHECGIGRNARRVKSSSDPHWLSDDRRLRRKHVRFVSEYRARGFMEFSIHVYRSLGIS